MSDAPTSAPTAPKPKSLIDLFRRFTNRHFATCADEHKEGVSDAAVKRRYDKSLAAEKEFLDAMESEIAECRKIIKEQANLRCIAEEGLAHMTALKNEIHKSYQAEIAALREWKRQHLLVESWWAKIDEFVRSQPDARLGESVSGTALKWLRELPALREDKARLDWLENSGAKVFRETEESVACMKIVVALEIGQDFPPQFTVRGCLDAARKAAP